MMYSKILVPLDGSRLSEGILPYVRFLARAFKVPIELLQVIDPNTIEASSRPRTDRYSSVAEADMTRIRNNYLNETARLYLPSLTVNRSVEKGNPAAVVVNRAAAHAGTLIAMSTRGRSGVQRWLLGSVADKVLHICNNPLLLVCPADKGTTLEQTVLKTVLVPLDGSPLAEFVLPYVAGMATEMNLEVVLVRAYSVPTENHHLGEAEGYLPDIEQLIETLKEDAKDYLDEKAQQLRAEGVKRVSCKLLAGEAADKIIDLAQVTPDNLVAMCTHGRSGIGRWVLGSATDRVIRHSGNPVLVIRSA